MNEKIFTSPSTPHGIMSWCVQQTYIQLDHHYLGKIA